MNDTTKATDTIPAPARPDLTDTKVFCAYLFGRAETYAAAILRDFHEPASALLVAGAVAEIVSQHAKEAQLPPTVEG